MGRDAPPLRAGAGVTGRRAGEGLGEPTRRRLLPSASPVIGSTERDGRVRVSAGGATVESFLPTAVISTPGHISSVVARSAVVTLVACRSAGKERCLFGQRRTHCLPKPRRDLGGAPRPGCDAGRENGREHRVPRRTGSARRRAARNPLRAALTLPGWAVSFVAVPSSIASQECGSMYDSTQQNAPQRSGS